MRTLVISDLHLGLRHGTEALRRPAALGALLERLDGVERLVLLGDVLELRHGPARNALAIAEPVLRAFGDALGAGGVVVIVPGNHDHAIGAGWLDWRGRREEPEALALDERIPADRAAWIAKRLATFLAPASVEVAYPGLWLRDDVYAMHGHYADIHLLVPTLERLAAGVMARLVGAVPDPATPDDYEALLAPLYALS
ncbi:MAG TPA: metallophosphoesterase, partial [Solirubrobacteraceae bacterium]|nr:metallophosphoesterase [Solirubrobacteraceae bacterium]